MPNRKRTKKKERPSWPLNPGHDRGTDVDVSPFTLPEHEESPQPERKRKEVCPAIKDKEPKPIKNRPCPVCRLVGHTWNNCPKATKSNF